MPKTPFRRSTTRRDGERGQSLVEFALIVPPLLLLILGVILGPLLERKGRQSLQLTGGDASGLVGGPVAWVCYALIVLALAWPLVAKVIKARRGEHHDVETKSEVSV